MCGQRPWNCKISTPNTITGTISDIYWWCSEPGTNSWLCLILRTSNTNTQGSNRMTDRWPGNETQESQDWTIFLQNLEVWGNRVCFLFCLTSTLYWCYLDSSVGTIAFFYFKMLRNEQTWSKVRYVDMTWRNDRRWYCMNWTSRNQHNKPNLRGNKRDSVWKHIWKVSDRRP